MVNGELTQKGVCDGGGGGGGGCICLLNFLCKRNRRRFDRANCNTPYWFANHNIFAFCWIVRKLKRSRKLIVNDYRLNL